MAGACMHKQAGVCMFYKFTWSGCVWAGGEGGEVKQKMKPQQPQAHHILFPSVQPASCRCQLQLREAQPIQHSLPFKRTAAKIGSVQCVMPTGLQSAVPCSMLFSVV